MAREEAGSGVQRAYAILFAYVIAMVEEVGTEKAFSVLSRVVEERGKADGRALIRNLGIEGRDIDSGLAVYSAFLTQGGIRHEVIEKAANRVLIRIGKCPIYDAYYGTGIACDWLVEVMCKNLALPLITSVLREVNHKLRSVVKRYRSYSEGFCLEELILENTNNGTCYSIKKSS